MKKPITIPNVDIELYENIKEHCKQEGTSISTFFNSMLAAGFTTVSSLSSLSLQAMKLNEHTHNANAIPSVHKESIVLLLFS